MHRAAPTFMLAVMLSACAGPTVFADHSQIHNLSAYYGDWYLTPLSRRFAYPFCGHRVSFQISETTFIYRSGKLQISASYQANPVADALEFHLSDHQHNGEKSCRKASPDVAVRDLGTRQEFALIDGRLRHFTPGRQKLYIRGYPRTYAEFQRRMMADHVSP
jgi:hypothetical protein